MSCITIFMEKYITGKHEIRLTKKLKLKKNFYTYIRMHVKTYYLEISFVDLYKYLFSFI
jgi:hypothetical protein